MKNRILGGAGTRITAVAVLAATAALGTAGTAAAHDDGVGAQSWHLATVGGGNSGGQVALRDCYHPVQLPSTSCSLVKYVPTGTEVRVVCQRSGQNISGNSVWDYVVYSGGEGYMSDYYLFTGADGFIPGVDRCS